MRSRRIPNARSSHLTLILYGHPANPFKQNLGWLNSFLPRSVKNDATLVAPHLTHRHRLQHQQSEIGPETGQTQYVLWALPLFGLISLRLLSYVQLFWRLAFSLRPFSPLTFWSRPFWPLTFWSRLFSLALLRLLTAYRASQPRW